MTLTETNRIYITDPLLEGKTASGGYLIHFDKVNEKEARGTIRIHIRNDDKRQSSITARASLSNSSYEQNSFESIQTKIEGGSEKELLIDIHMEKPALWSPKIPNLYQLKLELLENGIVVDHCTEKIGIRKIRLETDGLYINEEKFYIKGTNRHQEYPYIGYAISKNANYRDAVKIKQAGFDFVRLSHYPQGKSFLKACDELGILVMNAIPGWQYFGDSVFLKNSYQDIRDMVRRDRNHPCVVFWEVSLNESNMSEEYMIEANRILREELPFEDTYSAGWMDHESFDLFIPARQHAKAPNYWNQYKIGSRPLFIAEYGDWEYYAQNAGFNQTQYKNLKEEERTSRQFRGYGEKRLLQQAMNYQESANSNRFGPNTIGDANWLIFDYNRGYANDIEASGICDIFRLPKFSYYFYQSQRPPNDTIALKIGTGPMVKIASYWTEESEKPVTVFSNCEEVALYLNDSLIGRSNPRIDQYSNNLDFPPFLFELKDFEPGKLEAIGFMNNKKVATDVVSTPGKPSNIMVEVDTSGKPIDSNEMDIVFVYAKITDEKGTLVANSNAEVTFETNTGKLIGQNPVKAEAGIASILLKTNGLKEEMVVSAYPKGLSSNEVHLQ